LPASKVHAERPADAAFAPAASGWLAVVGSSLSNSFSGVVFAPEAAAPPVRLHLLKQSLLV
jgi:hypothetical protein